MEGDWGDVASLSAGLALGAMGTAMVLDGVSEVERRGRSGRWVWKKGNPHSGRWEWVAEDSAETGAPPRPELPAMPQVAPVPELPAQSAGAVAQFDQSLVKPPPATYIARPPDDLRRSAEPSVPPRSELPAMPQVAPAPTMPAQSAGAVAQSDQPLVKPPPATYIARPPDDLRKLHDIGIVSPYVSPQGVNYPEKLAEEMKEDRDFKQAYLIALRDRYPAYYQETAGGDIQLNEATYPPPYLRQLTQALVQPVVSDTTADAIGIPRGTHLRLAEAHLYLLTNPTRPNSGKGMIDRREEYDDAVSALHRSSPRFKYSHLAEARKRDPEVFNKEGKPKKSGAPIYLRELYKDIHGGSKSKKARSGGKKKLQKKGSAATMEPLGMGLDTLGPKNRKGRRQSIGGLYAGQTRFVRY